jgi:hypothetical protein
LCLAKKKQKQKQNSPVKWPAADERQKIAVEAKAAFLIVSHHLATNVCIF